MLRVAFNISWKKHPTKRQLCGNLPLVSLTLKMRRLVSQTSQSLRVTSFCGHLNVKEDPLEDLKITLDTISMIFQQPCLMEMDEGNNSSVPKLNNRPDDDDVVFSFTHF